jgi:hypothetical protein
MGFDIAQLNVFKKASEVVIIVSGSVAVLFPALQKIIRATAQEYLCIHYYLKYGECKQEITGKLSSLIKEVAKYNSNITEVEIHTYSFGGILAIDTFFPKNNQPIDKSVSEKVTHLVTVACPFDFLRVYYKHYFENRNNNNTSIKQWVNVFNKLDVLSSNFRNDTKTERSEDKISPGGISILNIEYEVTDTGQINWMDYLFLLSMKSHRMYWNDEPNSNSFFTNYLASNTLSA